MAGLLLAVTPLAVGVPASLGAQLSGTLDAGFAHVHYEEFLPSGAVSLAPAVRWERPDLVVMAAGALSRFESGNMNGHGLLAASWFQRLSRGMQAELTGTVAAGAHQTVGSSGMGQGQFRLHLTAGRRQGLWVGGGAGLTALGNAGHGSAFGEVAGWMRRGGLVAQLLARPVGSGGLHWTDVEGEARWQHGPVELGAQGGVRWGDATAYARSWLAGDAAWWMHPRLAVVASAGRWPADPARGTIGGRHVSIALRIATRPANMYLRRATAPSTAPPAGTAPGVLPIPPPVRSGGAGVATAFAALPAADGRTRLRLLAPGAREVEVMGDFSEWRPIRLRPAADGAWETALHLAPGVRRLNLRVDGGPWQVPPGLPAADDDFDGEVGLLVVRGGTY